MNAGLSNLRTLKRHLLAERLRPELTWDSEIAAIGLGVAASMERYCNRVFERAAGITWSTSSLGRTAFVLPRYPIEAVTAVDLRTSYSDAWESQTLSDLILQVDESAGLVIFNEALGWNGSVVRFTFTGGYWWDTTEDSSGTLPSGATALPADLQHAWLLQCAEVWSRRDNLGTGLVKAPSASAKLSEYDIIPAVAGVLRSYIRHG